MNFDPIIPLHPSIFLLSNNNTNWLLYSPLMNFIINNASPDVIIHINDSTDFNVYNTFCHIIRLRQLSTRIYSLHLVDESELAEIDKITYLENIKYHNNYYQDFSKLHHNIQQINDTLNTTSVDILVLDVHVINESVNGYIENILPKLKEGALILLHGLNRKRFDSNKSLVLNKLMTQYPHNSMEFGDGLTLLVYSKAIPKAFEFLFKPSPQLDQTLEHYFYRQGQLLSIEVAAMKLWYRLRESNSFDMLPSANFSGNHSVLLVDFLNQIWHQLSTNSNTEKIVKQQLQLLETSQHDAITLRQELQQAQQQLYNYQRTVDTIYALRSWKLIQAWWHLRERIKKLFQLSQFRPLISPSILKIKFNKEKTEIPTKLTQEYLQIRDSGIFDPDWYRQAYQDTDDADDLLMHFIKVGLPERRNPNPLFDMDWFCNTYEDMKNPDIHPLIHYLISGWREHQNPSPYFSVLHYLQNYPNVGIQEKEPLSYFLTQGVIENHLPTPICNTNSSNIDPTFNLLLKFPEKQLSPQSLSYNKKRLRIHWVIPDFLPGGGGHMSIFKTISYLESFGHQCFIWIRPPHMHQTAEEAYKDLVAHYKILKSQVRLLFHAEDMEDMEGDIIIATDAWSVYPVLSASRFKRRFYFVQDYEPSFYPMGSHFLMAESTYRKNLDCLCGSDWLENLLTKKYNVWGRAFSFAVDDPEYYIDNSDTKNSISTIAFYARFSTPRRAVELALLSLIELTKRGIQFQVAFFGSDLLPQSMFPYPFTNYGILDHEGLANLYRSADVGLVLSSTNYSLVPQEMIRCGLPVVDIDSESTRDVLPEDVVLKAAPDPKAIADNIQKLLEDSTYRHQQIKTALAWSHQFDWLTTAKVIEQTFIERIEFAIERNEFVQPVSHPIVSVVIPTYNGGNIFKDVLKQILQQKLDDNYEVIIIDSGSTDDTVNFVKRMQSNHSVLRFIQINQSDFQHGATRNYSISLAQGLYVAFLTQDALPANTNWLRNLILPLQDSPKVAGVFGRHLAHKEADVFVSRRLESHFANLANYPVLDKNTNRNDLSWQRILRFFSDNNSCLRKSVWSEVPYPNVDFGEDQLWALMMIDAGYQKVYAKEAVVHHSHQYTIEEAYERAKTEAYYTKVHFRDIILPNKLALDFFVESENNFDKAIADELNLPKHTLSMRKKINQARGQGLLDGGRMAVII
jgi:glycosyltransferase involved in cell wall biosynthesis